MFPDLPAFLRHLESQGDLLRIRAEADPELEITEIADRVVRKNGPALLFENVKGSEFPVAINLFGADRRVEWAIGRKPEAVGEELVSLIDRLSPPTLAGLWSSRSTIRRILNARTRRVTSAPVQAVTEVPALSRWPILKCWPGDAGRFLTFGMTITHSPKTHFRNVGLYRHQLFSDFEIGMHWQIQKGGGFHYAEAQVLGQALPAAVALGGPPALMIASMCPLPEGVDEMAFAAFLQGRTVKTVRGRTVPFEIPASAEFVMEGEVDPNESRVEGPFGDHYGHYSSAAPFPVLKIRSISRRRQPIYPATVVGKPPMEDFYLGRMVARMFEPILRRMRPEIRRIWSYGEAGFHNLLVVSVSERYEREALKTALGLLGEGLLSLTKCLIVVDESVDVENIEAVMKAVGTHFEPTEDFLLLPKTAQDTLDFTGPRMNLGSKMVINAARRREGGASGGALRDPRTLDRRIRDWRLVGDSFLIVQVESEGRAVLERLLPMSELGPVRMAAAVSADVDLADPMLCLWGVFTRFDCARDVFFHEMELRGSVPVYRGRMGIDATWRKGYPEPLKMDAVVAERVNRRWGDYGF